MEININLLDLYGFNCWTTDRVMGGQGSLMLVESEGWLNGLIQQLSYCSPNAKKCNACAFHALFTWETPGTWMYYEKKANQRQCVFYP